MTKASKKNATRKQADKATTPESTGAGDMERPKEAKPKAVKAKPKSQRKRMEPRPPREELVVFAFRLSVDERELIHRAAGPARASRFVRALAVAAACHDETAIRQLLQSTRETA